MVPESPSRRHFIRIGTLTGAAALAVACAPAAAPAPVAAPSAPAPQVAAWEKEWQTTVEAAKKEGKVTLAWILGGGGGYSDLIDDFNAAFPGITAELTTMASGSLLIPKALQEHEAGIYSFDLIFTQVNFADTLLKAGALQPLRPNIFHPDALDDSKWNNGFEAGWVDSEKNNGYGFAADISMIWWMNTDIVKEGEITTAQDLINPKWKGQILLTDPRSGYTYSTALVLRENLGDEYLRKLFVDQCPAWSRDNRLITEQMVKGQYAIATGVPNQILGEFLKQGLGKNLKKFGVPEGNALGYGHQMWMLKGAPNSNAAKVFLNWFLTKEGQTAYVESTETNSRRLDVAQGNPVTAPQPGKEYVWVSGNSAMTQKIADMQKFGSALMAESQEKCN